MYMRMYLLLWVGLFTLSELPWVSLGSTIGLPDADGTVADTTASTLSLDVSDLLVASGDKCDPSQPRCGLHRTCLDTGACVCDNSREYGHWAGKNCTECAADAFGPKCAGLDTISFCTEGVTNQRLCRLTLPPNQKTKVKFNYTLRADPNDPDSYKEGRIIVAIDTIKGTLKRAELKHNGKTYFRTNQKTAPCGRNANSGNPDLCLDPQNESPCPRANRPGVYIVEVTTGDSGSWDGVLTVNVGDVGALESRALCASDVLLLLPGIIGLAFCCVMYISFLYFTKCYNRPCVLNDPYHSMTSFYLWAFLEIIAAGSTVTTIYWHLTLPSAALGVFVGVVGILIVCCKPSGCITPLYVTLTLLSIIAPIVTCLFLVLQKWNRHKYMDDPQYWFQVPLAGGVIQAVSLLAMALVITSTSKDRPDRMSVDYQMRQSVARDDL